MWEHLCSLYTECNLSVWNVLSLYKATMEHTFEKVWENLCSLCTECVLYTRRVGFIECSVVCLAWFSSVCLAWFSIAGVANVWLMCC